jgi:predicted transcriptional regulator
VVTMKDSTIMVLDDADHEFIRMLRNLGAPRNLAFVIVYLKNVNEATSREIEQGIEISYSERSTAIQALRNLKWIESTEFKRIDGRRKITYALKIPLEKIVKHFSEEKLRESVQERESISKLKLLANSRNRI